MAARSSKPKAGGPKSKLITAILNAVGSTGDTRKSQRVQLEGKTVDILRKTLAKAQAAKAGGQQKQSSKPKRTSSKGKRTSKQKTSGSRRSSKKLPKALLQRVTKIKAGIKAGKIVVKQQIASPSDYQTGTLKQKYEKFAEKYKGARVSKRKGGGAKRQSVKKIYAQLTGSKHPYYLSRGYSVKGFKVGGGAAGPGTIRAIPGSGAPPFSTLSAAEQGKIANFLNSAQGQKLRSKGAKKQVALAQMQSIAKQKKAVKKKGAANTWW